MKSSNGVWFVTTSRFNGERIIVAIPKRKSKNAKTGDVLQVFVIPWDFDYRSCGDTESCCGHCPNRHEKGGGCYVRRDQSVVQIWRAIRERMRYEWLDFDNPPAWTQYRIVRLTAYGDIGALHRIDFERLMTCLRPRKAIGYTHAWCTGAPWLRDWCLASVESRVGRAGARALGYKCFMTRPMGAPTPERKRHLLKCPNGRTGIKCRDCLLCQAGLPGPDVWIEAHGIRSQKINCED